MKSWAVYDVADQGQTIALRTRIADCAGGISPDDIVTANGFVPTPPPTPTKTVPPTPTHTDTATPTPMHTATPPPTPTFEPRPIYLPVTLAESCDPLRKHTDVVLVLDASTGMLHRTGAGRTKLAAAQEAATAFLRLMDFSSAGGGQDQAAIVGFNDTAWVETDLKADAAAIERAVGRLAEKVAQGTRLDLALDESVKTLLAPSRESDNTPVLILLTDGLPNHMPTPTPSGSQEDTVLAVAQRAKDLGFRLYVIGVGYPDAPDIADRINPELLRAIASHSSTYYQTPDAEDLASIYSEIAHTIDCPPGQFWSQR